MDSQPTPDEPSDTELPPKPQTLAQCHAVIDALGLQIAQLREQMNALQERLKLNSRNSSKPPSSDGPGSGGNRAQRRASGRSRGAQPGHKGSYRVMLPVEEVSAIHECGPPSVCECGGPVQAGKPLRHQVWDVPAQIRPEVQEYRLYQGVLSLSAVFRPFRFRRNQASDWGDVFGVIRPARFRHIPAS